MDLRSAAALTVCLIAIWSAATCAAEPVITAEQIEADWLRQDELLRNATKDGSPEGRGIAPEEDAAGAVDGARTGRWGFHTLHEANPWWQVDLGKPTAVERIVLFNRCDDGFGGRNRRIQVLFSADGRQFEQVYQHDGTDFGGHGLGQPLTVRLAGKATRYVRLQLPGTSYFHLDEVEVFAAGGEDNVALHKPATQSSVSQWSQRHRTKDESGQEYDVARVVENGLRLAESLRLLGLDVAEPARQLKEIDAADDDATSPRERYMRARWTVRRLALANPLLDFDEILFVKRAPGMFPHVSDQYYGWWSRPGGGLYVLSDFRGERPTLRCLTDALPAGSFLRPDLSFDGRRIVFAYCRHYPHLADVADKTRKDELPEDSYYHLFEMNVDGTDVRQLTHGPYHDFDARYLPSGRIVFISTRKGIALQAGRRSALATMAEVCPDSFVRCGGGNHRPVPVFSLHTMAADGTDICAISAFENFEWTPTVASDGRILYARWDYIDRFNGHFFSLWSTNPDGTNAQLVYGNYTKRPQCTFEARSVPGSDKLMFTATAHHSITGGSVVLLDRTRGSEFERPLTRLTPEVCFPETEGWPAMYFSGPWPLSKDHFLAAWSDRPLPAHRLMAADDPNNPVNASGIYLCDAFGNRTLLHRDASIASATPIPIRSRPRPPELPDMVAWDGPQEGRFLLQDVYLGLPGLARGSVTRLRVVGVPPKEQPHMNQPNLGVSAEDPGKFVLGTVPVEADGSAYFRVPSGVPVLFQALDADGRAVQTMRSLTYVQPGQTLGCIGCHEHRDRTPTPSTMPLAAGRKPSKLRLGPPGSWPLRYDQLVQPVLDRHCVRCHRAGGEMAEAARWDLTPRASYDVLLNWGEKDLHRLVFERDISAVGDCASRQSKLLAMLTADEAHYDVQLDAADLERLTTWMDTYAQRQGHFSAAQAQRLIELRKSLAPMLQR